MIHWLVTSNEVSNDDTLFDKNVIKKIHWRRRLIDGSDQTDIFDVLELPEHDDQNFIEYENLTYQIYCEWLEKYLDVTNIDNTLRDRMNLIKNPPTRNLELPFNNIEIDVNIQNGINPTTI